MRQAATVAVNGVAAVLGIAAALGGLAEGELIGAALGVVLAAGCGTFAVDAAGDLVVARLTDVVDVVVTVLGGDEGDDDAE